MKQYLRAQVGRPWDKVYSEICQSCSKDGAVNAHIFQHLYDFIETNVTMKDGKPGVINLRFQRRGWQELYANYNNEAPIYVDPRDGIIKRYDRAVANKKKREAVAKAELAALKAKHVVVDEYLEFAKVAGIWYKYKLSPMPEPTPTWEKPEGMLYSEWTLLSPEGRKKFGVCGMVPPKIHDMWKDGVWLADERIFHKEAGVDRSPGTYAGPSAWLGVRKDRQQVPATRYYSARHQASKAEMKKYNLK